MKTDKDGTLTKEYIDYVKGLEREDLERFYIGADLYNYSISNDNERLQTKINKAIEYIMSELITEYDIKYGGNVRGSDLPVEAITPILEILKGEDNEI